jgi:hypothetical protein
MSTRTSRHRNAIDFYPLNYDEKKHIHKPGRTDDRSRKTNKHSQAQFRCTNCALLIAADRAFSGVNNRNHCPNCLWSKHVDLEKPGDRKAGCRSRMQPIGLTVKKTGKKYGSACTGELMLVHRCTGCGKISINRIASDDATGALIQLYRDSQGMAEPLRQDLEQQGIHPLLAGDLTTVYSQLFGWQSILEEFAPPPEVMAFLEKSEPANNANEVH